jgi:hypothetical protein
MLEWEGGLPDDIEQYLINDQRTRATVELMKRRGLTIDQARVQVGRWLFNRAKSTAPPDSARDAQ